jgi:hypothetical protein
MFLHFRYELDDDNEEYKRFKLLQLAAKWEQGGHVIYAEDLPAPQDPISECPRSGCAAPNSLTCTSEVHLPYPCRA